MPKKKLTGRSGAGVYMAKTLRNAKNVLARTQGSDILKRGSGLRKSMATNMRAKQKYTKGAYMSTKSIAGNKRHQRNMIKANYGS